MDDNAAWGHIAQLLRWRAESGATARELYALYRPMVGDQPATLEQFVALLGRRVADGFAVAEGEGEARRYFPFERPGQVAAPANA